MEDMYLVSEKKIRCVSVAEHVAVDYGPITEPEAAQKLLEPFFANEPYEMVYAVALDSSNRFLGFIKTEEGTVNSSMVHIRKILTFLLCETSATGMILAHNHPGGNGNPSREDLALTKKLYGILKEVDIRLLDHVIYAPSESGRKGKWTSMQAQGLFD